MFKPHGPLRAPIPPKLSLVTSCESGGAAESVPPLSSDEIVKRKMIFERLHYRQQCQKEGYNSDTSIVLTGGATLKGKIASFSEKTGIVTIRHKETRTFIDTETSMDMHVSDIVAIG